MNSVTGGLSHEGVSYHPRTRSPVAAFRPFLTVPNATVPHPGGGMARGRGKGTAQARMKMHVALAESMPVRLTDWIMYQQVRPGVAPVSSQL
ncbi:hypothetical protein NCCP1664_02430 [Zafaria cholistanensis]|uniref:Uncharacterized protein n=1 Tax=Zafaria cholistanensis TaxID=1682741 RepID=A0A5A7NMM3_9MICC|nr:hypothetical protein NCCP1664_02430 [Zafaria cholistanensis]